jgi:phosphoribosylamine--glycine ligase
MEKKRFLFVSFESCGSDIAWQCAKEGHDVKFYIQNKPDRDIGDGFVQKVDDWKAEVTWADVIVFDDIFGFGNAPSQLRKAGKLVVGGTPYTDRLEGDRSFGQSELKRHGIPVLNFQEFNDFDLGIQYVKEHPDAYVIKPSGEAQNHKQLLFVGQEDDGGDVIRTLEAYKKVWAKKIKVFQLQKKVNGVEIGVGGFFNGSRFITPLSITFEHKKLFPGEVGPPTGEMGSSMFWSQPNRFFNATIKKFEETLAAEKYVGFFDLNCIVNGYGIYPLEFTARFGYPTIQIQQEGMMIPTGEFLYMLASGADFELKTKKGFQVGVVLVVAPFPYEDKHIFDIYSKDATVVFKKPNQFDGMHLQDTKLVNGEWVVGGYTGCVMVVTGSGQTMKQAQQQAYGRVQNVLIPNMYYRTDIGDRWFEDSDKLHNWGYLREA